MATTVAQQSKKEDAPRQAAILEAVGNSEKPLKPSQIAELTGLHPDNVRSAVREMLADGLLMQPGYGKYALPEDAPPEEQVTLENSPDAAEGRSPQIVAYRMEEAGGGPARMNGDKFPVHRRQLQAALGYVPDPEKAFWVRVRGRSVEPWISNGAIVLVEVCSAVKEPDYYVFWQDEEEGHLIKYMERVGSHAIRVTQYGPEPRSDVLEHEGDDVYRFDDGRTVRIDIKGRVAYPPLVGHSVLSTVTNELRKIVGQ